MDSQAQDRNLPATARKLMQARRDGEAARSRDLGHLAVLGTGCVGLLLLAPWLSQQLQHSMVEQLAFNAQTLTDPAGMVKRLQAVAMTGLLGASAFAGLVMVASVLSTLAVGGFIASAKPIQPNFNRINPLAGLSNLFSKQQAVNTLKLVGLSLAVAVLAWVFIANSLPSIAALVLQPSGGAIRKVCDWLVSGVGLLLLVVVASAVIDVPLSLYFHSAKLKMSHQEVKQENKETDGNPHMKGKMRAAARENAQRASITKVPRADFVLMNPTHYAVALQYDDKNMSAPQVIAKGADLLAMRIREIAKSHSIPVIQSPMLARALYAHADLDRPIPATLYTAVAQVLAYVYRLKAALRGEMPMPGEPPEPFVPAELDPHQKSAKHGGADAIAATTPTETVR